MKQDVHVALIGCGRVAGRHIEATLATEGVKLSAVCDINDERSREKGAMGSVLHYANYHQMLAAHPEIDVVSVITPSGAHYAHAVDLLKHYDKHLLIEKPMAMTLTEAREVGELATAKGLMVMPVFQNRFNKSVQFLKEKIGPGNALGSLRVGTVRMRWCRPQRYYDLADWRGTYAMDGGALTNQGIHYIDLLRYLCGDVVRVTSKMARLGATLEAEDTVVSVVEFESGALGVIEIMTCARHEDFEASVSCVCEEGLAVIGGSASNALDCYSPEPSVLGEQSEEFPTIYGFGHNAIYAGVRDAVAQNAGPPIAFDDGMKTLELLHSLYRSDEVGGWLHPGPESESERLGKPDDVLLAPYLTPYESFQGVQ